MKAPPANKKENKGDPKPKGKVDSKPGEPKAQTPDAKQKAPSPRNPLDPKKVTENWEAAEKLCPEGMDIQEHLRRSARGHMVCTKQNIDGGCSFGKDCQFRHTDEITAGQKYVMEVGLGGTIPSKQRMQQYGEPDGDFKPPQPSEPAKSCSKGTIKSPAPEPVAAEGPQDTDDDDGFQVYRPKKSVFFDSRVKPGPKGQYVVRKVSKDFATPLMDLTPESQKVEQDFRIRMANKFEPNLEVASLIRSGAEILPHGSSRSAKGVPAETWQQQRRTENPAAHPHVYYPQDMSQLMLMDVGPETDAALLDDDLEREDSVDLSSQEDEDLENILALKAKAEGHRLLTDYFQRATSAPSVPKPPASDDCQLVVIQPDEIDEIMDGIVTEGAKTRDSSDCEESEYRVSTNSDCMSLCGCSTLLGGTDSECTRCSQCPNCCDCANQQVRLLHLTHQEHPELLLYSMFDHFSRHSLVDYDQVQNQPKTGIFDVLDVVLDWIRFPWNQKKSSGSHQGMSHFYFTHPAYKARVEFWFGTYANFESTFKRDINRMISTTSKTCIAQQLMVARRWKDDAEQPFWSRSLGSENLITLKLASGLVGDDTHAGQDFRDARRR